MLDECAGQSGPVGYCNFSREFGESPKIKRHISERKWSRTNEWIYQTSSTVLPSGWAEACEYQCVALFSTGSFASVPLGHGDGVRSENVDGLVSTLKPSFHSSLHRQIKLMPKHSLEEICGWCERWRVCQRDEGKKER